MSVVVIGHILGVSFACGLNLYLTVAALGILSRIGFVDLPPGLHGLEGLIVIVSAVLLFLVEAVIDKVRHVDSLWDTVHTFIRPPAAALLALGILWGAPVSLAAPAAAAAFVVALIAHGTKAGLRLALNAAMRGGRSWVSLVEDLLAVGFATMAFLDPTTALIGTLTALALVLLVGPRYWRAFRLGLRALFAWMRTLFATGRWREESELPRGVRKLLDPTSLGAAPPRGARAAIHGAPGAGAYRNGWLVATPEGPIFMYLGLFGHRRVDLPATQSVATEEGLWADVIHVQTEDEQAYRLYMLKDGPTLDLTIPHLHTGESPAAPIPPTPASEGT